ncbi:cellulose binding domain-containing protein [Spirosoma pollinicola]|nr:cellulose binding domain-containing protein [Spirosoma pollinicola]
MSISTLPQTRLGNPLSRFLRWIGSWINAPLNLGAIPALLLSLLTVLLTLTSVSAQTKYTADFSTQPTIDKYGFADDWPWNSTVTINLGGVEYLITDAINGSYTWNGSAIVYSTAGDANPRIKRKDGQPFNFYGVKLQYTNYKDPVYYTYPFLTIQYSTTGSALADEKYDADQTVTVAKPNGVGVTQVVLAFHGLNTLTLDDLVVGPTGAVTSVAPTVLTSAASGIGTTIATLGGNVTADGGASVTQRGVVYSTTNATPTTSDTKVVIGSGTGTFSQSITGLTSSTTYYVRAYATNSVGTSYGSQQTFVTLPPAPAFIRQPVTTSACTGNTAAFTVTASAATSFQWQQSASADFANPTTVAPGSTIITTGTSSTLTVLASSSLNGDYFRAVASNVSGNVNSSTAQLTVFTVNEPSVKNVAYCQFTTADPLTATASVGNSLTWYSADGSRLAGAPTPSTSIPTTTTYYVSQTNGFGCEGPRAAITITVNALPTVSINGLASAYCQDAGIVTLNGSPADGHFTLDGTPATNFNTASLPLGQHTTVYSYTNTNGCVNSTSQTITIKATPTAPSLVTASGQPFPVGVSNLTASQNTGSVILTVGGCSGGTITWNGGNSTTLAVSTSTLGIQTYTATCTQNGCIGPVASFLLTVVPTSLSVLHRDQDYGNTQNNIIKPFLELANAGSQAIPYSEVTVRYWLTSEGNAPATNFAVYYAPLGAVNMRYVMLAQPRQGAFGYVEYSFPGGGSLPMNGNSGPIENGIQKTDGSPFNESNDYSYQGNYANYTPNSHITAYRNGVIVWGQEPTVVTSQTAVQVYSAAMDNPTASQIKTRVELRNTGNVPLPVSSLKLRYYFTSDNGQLANVYVDYADMGTANVQARVMQLASPVNGADSYVELSFSGNTGQLNPLSSLGFVDFRLVRSDYGLFNQANDYSYAANYGNVGLNNHITAYLNNNLVFGTPSSGASARMIAQEPTSVLQAHLLGNPVVGDQAMVEIRGAGGQSLTLKLVDLQGRPVHELRVDQAGDVEQVSMPLGQSRGALLLRISGATQQQVLKVIRP